MAIRSKNSISKLALCKYGIGIVSIGLLSSCAPDNPSSNNFSDADRQISVGAAAESPSVAVLELSNPSSFDRDDEGVYLSFYELGINSDQEYFIVKSADNTFPVDVVDKDGNGQNDGLFFVVDIAAEQTLSLQLEAVAGPTTNGKRTQAEISHKVGGHWNENIYEGGTFQNVEHLVAPPQYKDHSEWIRYEGPGIESDQIGYRVYLDWRNGFDIFGKTGHDIVLQDVGQDGYDSYHEPADWGMDLLSVGDSLGIGGYGYWNGEKAIRVSEVDRWQADITNNSDLLSSFKIQYDNWQPAEGLATDLSAHLTMQAGSRWVEVEATSSEALPNIITGVVRHENTELVQGDLNITNKAWTYLGTYGPQSLEGGQLGMALLVQRGSIKEIVSDSLNEVVILNPTELPPSENSPKQKIHYYFLAAWDKEPDSVADSKEEFEAYVQQQAERLTLPLRITIKSALSVSTIPDQLEPDTPLAFAKQLAYSEIKRKARLYAYGGFDIERARPAFFEYTTGLLMQSFSALSKATGEEEYRNLAYDVVASFISEDGIIYTYNQDNYNIDSINTGKMVIELHQQSKRPNFLHAVEILREQLEHHPRTSEGAFWHKKRYPNQLWLDGVYMGMPFLAAYESLYSAEPDYSEVVNEFNTVFKHLRDEETGLFYHAWDEQKQQEWADKETGLSRFFWGRGMGWYAMALVDVLDFIPETANTGRETLLKHIESLAQAITSYQDSQTGTWYQILDQPEHAGNYTESSASAMFTYFLAKAINNKYLPTSYQASTLQAYQGMLNEFIEVHLDGTISLTQTCSVAGLGYGRDGSYHYYMSEQIVKDDPKAVGPFIMASIEMSELLANQANRNDG